MIQIESLVINITDICGMDCAFCLRGDKRGRKIDLSLIPRIFDGIDKVHSLTISGGEPGCNVEAVTVIVDYMTTHKDDLHVNGFFIATNGQGYHQELVDAVKEAAFLFAEREYGLLKTIDGTCMPGIHHEVGEISDYFGLAVSMDKFHDPIPFENWLKYYMSGVYSNSKESDFDKESVLARGYGTGIYGSIERPLLELYVQESQGVITASEVYVTVDGLVFADCDMSYEMEASNEPYGDLNESPLSDIIRKEIDNENNRKGTA